MNIYYISNSAVPSRSANSIHTIKMCQAYSRLGHDVTLVVPDWKKDRESGVKDIYEFYGTDERFRIRTIPMLSGRRLDFVHRALMMPLPAFCARPNLVHSRGLTSAWGLTRLFRLPTIYESHQPLEEASRMQRMFSDISKSRHLRAFVFITRALADYMQSFIPQKVRTIIAPDGVDSSWLADPKDRFEARKKLGIDCGSRQLAVYTGHLYTGRGIELIIDLSRSLPECYFLIVGGTDADIARFRPIAGSQSNLYFAGFKPPADVKDYLQAADVLLMPYAKKVLTSEGGDTTNFASPMKMFEYLSAGRPIIASDLPVLREVLTHGRNALLVPYDEPSTWTEQIKRLNNDKLFASTLSDNARQDAAQFTWENRARRLLEQSDVT